MPASPLAQNLLKHGIVSGLRLIATVEWQCCTARTVRVRSDPRVLVGEAPGLNRSAAWILQTSPYDAAIYLSLSKKIVAPGQAVGIHGQGDVEFRDVHLHSQRRQPRNVGRNCCSVKIKLRDV